jgi:hypothetical protein
MRKGQSAAMVTKEFLDTAQKPYYCGSKYPQVSAGALRPCICRRPMRMHQRLSA